MENVELDLRNMYVANREHELSTKENGHFSWGKPRPNIKCCSAKEQEEEELKGRGREGEGGERRRKRRRRVGSRPISKFCRSEEHLPPARNSTYIIQPVYV